MQPQRGPNKAINNPASWHFYTQLGFPTAAPNISLN